MRATFKNKASELRLFWACTLPLILKPSPVVSRLARRWLGWLPKPCHALTPLGFTLAEVLIALALLGVIATFTIPKILAGSQDQRYNAIAKEMMGTISQAYVLYQQNNGASTTVTPGMLRQYMNYASIPGAGFQIDDIVGGVGRNCNTCARFQNGAVLTYWNESFGGSATTSAITFIMDPDGQVTDGTTNGPGKSIYFHLHYSGKVTTGATVMANTQDSLYTWTYRADPPWFSF